MGFPSFNLCDSGENTGSQDHSSHYKIKAVSELPHRKIPCAITMHMARLQLEFKGRQASQTLQLSQFSVFPFSFPLSPFNFFFSFLPSQNNMM